MAGKSGTAETGTPKPDAWFPAYCPGQRPAIAVATVLVQVQLATGGTDAAPLVRRVMSRYFAGVRRGAGSRRSSHCFDAHARSDSIESAAARADRNSCGTRCAPSPVISANAIPLRFQTAEVGVDWLQCNIECQEGCPVNTNCRGYLMLAAEGRFEEGYILARDPNPVAAICGYVCCAPCEKACRRADIDKPLAIRAMKRFLVDWHYGNNMPDIDRRRPRHRQERRRSSAPGRPGCRLPRSWPATATRSTSTRRSRLAAARP